MFEELFASGGLSFERLKSFSLVAQAGGIAKAAPGDLTKQSQFSRQLRELEEFFETELTQRRGKGIVLTAAGERLALWTRESFAGLDEMRKDAGNHPLTIRLGAGDTIFQWLLMPKIRDLNRMLANSAVELVALSSKDVVQQLDDLLVDFGVVRKSALKPNLHSKALGTLRFAFFVPVKLLPKDGGPAELLASLPLATQEGKGEFRTGLEAICRKNEIKLKVALSCTSFPLLLKAVQSKEYAAILPSVAEKDLDSSEFKRFDLPMLKPLDRELCLAWNPRVISVRRRARETIDCLVKILKQ